MLTDTLPPHVPAEDPRRAVIWPWRTALVLEGQSLSQELRRALEDLNVNCVFRAAATAPGFEVAGLVERERPDLLFVELARIEGIGSDWIQRVRGGGDLPLVVAVHPNPDPQTMIDALRAGASEFLSLPLRPAIFDAMDRVATLLESRQARSLERGRMIGILSAKGGCGATTLACHLAVPLQGATGSGKVLVADLDSQSPSAHRILRVRPEGRLGAAFESVRRLNSASWSDFVVPAACGIDLLAGERNPNGAPAALPEPWRVDSLFRFLARNYNWILTDLGRNLNPANWAFLETLDELIVVTAPDVLALYQTRSILQTLSGRGFAKERLRLILNRNRTGPQDFWVESIQQMFEMNVVSVIPDDCATLDNLPRERFEFPSNSSFGRAVAKLAGRISKPPGPDGGQRKSHGKAL